MSERSAWVVLAVVVVALVGSALALDPATLSGQRFWSDGATYYAMTWSLVEDGDLRYELRDLERVRREFPDGPQGLFLKRASGGLRFGTEHGFPWVWRVPVDRPELYYSKSLLYPVVAAPWVLLFGSRGLYLTNALFLSLALVLAFLELKRQAKPWVALALALVIFFACVTPIYVFWLIPELMNMGLVMAGLFFWRRNRLPFSLVAFGLAIYSKPYNLVLALPLGVDVLLRRGGLGLGLRESVRRGLLLAAVVVALFATNRAVTGELNYQGGERKTFYGRFPLESPDVRFGNSGTWMSTNQAGPRGWLGSAVDSLRAFLGGEPTGVTEPQPTPDVEDAPQWISSEVERPKGELPVAFLHNLSYFWIGRFGGALPYYPAAVLAALVFLVVGPRERQGYLALAAFVGSYVFYIHMIPDNWYGGSGAIGNRYFLNMLPLAVFLIPRGRELLVAIPAVVIGAIFAGPALVSPIEGSIQAGQHTLNRPHRSLPLELTMLNDLAIFTDRTRKKVSFGDTEGDAHKHWPADPKSYYLYFPDNGTCFQESKLAPREGHPEEHGFWLRGGQDAEIVLRALEPVKEMTFYVMGGPAGDVVTLRVSGQERQVTVAAGETQEARVTPGRAFPHYDTFMYVLKLSSSRGGLVRDPTERTLGAFVRIKLDVNRRPGLRVPGRRPRGYEKPK